MEKRPDFLNIGASGGVANAFLQKFLPHRHLFDRLVLLDKDKKILSNSYLDHKRLNYIFLQKELKLPEKEKEYLEILKEYRIDIVLDLTDADSLPLLEATDKAGVSYLNTSLNAEKKTVSDLVFEVLAKKNKFKHAVHILCCGMNPGIVNMWVRYEIEKFSLPKEIIHFEYDSSRIAKKWQPMITWSPKEFLVETVRDPSGIMLGKNKLKKLLPNALSHRVEMKTILQPIFKLIKHPFRRVPYPSGFTVLHEENITLSQKYDVPSKFIYALDKRTMDYLVKTYRQKGKVTEKDLLVGDNVKFPLEGSDNIGVILEYEDRRIYYFTYLSNSAVMRTNATYTQVVIGIFAALFTLLFEWMQPGIYFVEDLYDTYYPSYMFENMRVQEFVFKKKKNNLELVSYLPEIRFPRKKVLSLYTFNYGRKKISNS